MYDLLNFTPENLQACAIALRNMNLGATYMEETANRMVRYLYDHLVERETGQRACALVRFFKTHPYGELDEGLQKSTHAILGAREATPSTKCLTLLATAGDHLNWNSRQTSGGHKAIPLIDEEFIARAPMISQLIQQFGLEVKTVLQPDPDVLLDMERRTFNVFYVPEALGSSHIPAQTEFVIPYQIKSVLGFGGMLPCGNLFAIILFTKILVPRPTADLFKWMAAYARIPVASFGEDAIFADQQPF
ncbi:MAG TPA: hypothetical protein V6C57_18045 [Coleofasciculaceae cyanobacterium]